MNGINTEATKTLYLSVNKTTRFQSKFAHSEAKSVPFCAQTTLSAGPKTVSIV
jgi:hypothetical protein